MKHLTLFALAVSACLLAALPPSAHAGETPADGWVCPPCIHNDLDKVYDEPGSCPVCGMSLVERSSIVYAAILVFDGVQIIDFTGPYEVFGQAHFYTYLVSADGKPLTTSMDMKVVPHFDLEHAPKPDLLLVPGGDASAVMKDQRVLDWIRGTAAEAEHVLSVCNGAFILAEAGLLDGLGATTFHRLLDDLAEDYPEVTVQREKRFVDNGKIVTSAGLSSGIDAAIHLVEKIQGRAAAHRLALHLEYDWDPDSPFVRGAMADRYEPDLDWPEGAHVELIEQDGDMDRWSWKVAVHHWPAQGPGLRTFLAQGFEAAGWCPASADGRSPGELWSFRDDKGRPWRGELQVTETDGGYRVVLSIDRQS